MNDKKNSEVDMTLSDSKYKKKQFQNKNIVCCNCGKSGHVYKKCFNPITSLGIICFKRKEQESVEDIVSKITWKQFVSNYQFDVHEYKSDIEFLLIRRKDSLSFAEFVRVKYNINDVDYIKKILGNMTTDEQEFLKQASTSDELWNRLWTSKKKSRTRINEYNRVKKKLTTLITGTHDKYGNFFSIKSLLADISTSRDYPEWGFPKGIRVPKESIIQCAMREIYKKKKKK